LHHAAVLPLSARLEQRVASRTALLEAANQELEGLVYSVSHDLRAPLRHIDGYVGLLRRKLESRLDDDTRPYMATVFEASRHMATLIDDLLAFSRLGHQRLEPPRVDLGALAREVVDEVSADARARVVHWRVGELPVVTGDRAMLRVVFVNLVSNALKFTAPRAEAEIALGSDTGPSGEAVVFVRDNGVGFDMAYGHKLFGVFERLHAITEFEGAGIGLANVRRIVERHGGRCWAEGHVGQGATFSFLLPAVEVPSLQAS
jgi:light-regulated signal transduction histidine kinase (bacteriophytochrome)